MQFNPVAAIASKNLPVLRMAHSNQVLEFCVKMKGMRTIADTLMRIATPGMKPKKLLKTAKREHPKASKKDIVRAAFFSIIANADDDHGKAKNLQSFGMAERVKMALDKSSPRQTR